MTQQIAAQGSACRTEETGREKIPSSLWEELPESCRESEGIYRPVVSLWKEILFQFFRRKTAVLGLLLVIFTILFAAVGPLFCTHSYDEQSLPYVNTSPVLTVYQTGTEEYYATSSFKLVRMNEDGTLGETIRSKREDGMNKRYVFELNGETYYLSYKTGSTGLQDASGSPIPTRKVWNKSYPLGTDGLGRDVLVRLMYGARISMTVAFVATLVTLLIGVLYGSISGYIGGTVDLVMMRIVDIISAIPLTMYVILIMVLFNNGGLISIIIALGSVYWVDMARVVRGEILTLKKREFVGAAHTMGSSTFYILRRHLIPNALGPIIVTATMQIPSAIFTEAFMSFIGLGVSAPMASWGMMCNDALEMMQSAPYQLAFPAGAICVAMFAFNFMGDGLRDAFDPQLRKT